DFTQAVNLIGSGGFNTPITYMPFTLGWDGTWLAEGRSTKLGMAFNFHVRGLVGDEQQFADKRFKGRSGYAYLRGNASHNETAASGWGASARTTWQLSPQPLISNEQFTIGGVDTVRGYLESAASGDTGIAVSLEATTPNFAKRMSDSLDDAHLLAFVDAGTVNVLSPITADDHYTLAGAGLGMRVKGWRGVTAAVDWAVALNELGNTRRGDSRIYFKFGYEW
ncbi:ShlB/FhaC/HecB family hemolysin secretion/activation protein, partial [Rhodoferax sp.]|uniref:ShlB/FhaC/HecB family hemolysin secretion/activation protein n=1 Tax=Rhodoferax sp. TaxID=50421 RepID=UPI0027180E69